MYTGDSFYCPVRPLFPLWQPNSNRGSLVLFLGDKTLPLTGLVLLTCHSWTLLGVSHQESAEGHDEACELLKLKDLTGKNEQASLDKERLLTCLV